MPSSALADQTKKNKNLKKHNDIQASTIKQLKATLWDAMQENNILKKKLVAAFETPKASRRCVTCDEHESEALREFELARLQELMFQQDRVEDALTENEPFRNGCYQCNVSKGCICDEIADENDMMSMHEDMLGRYI
jgi:hypothetical protein